MDFKFKRGSTAANASYTGLAGTVSIDTSKNTLRIHDGVTQGGLALVAETAEKLATARTINGVAFDGSANITVADSTKLPLAGGQLTGGISGVITSGSSGLYVHKPLQGYIGPPGSSAGTLKITLPFFYTSTMLQIRIRGYDYSSYGAWEIILGGYNYSSSNTWTNTSATVVGGSPFTSVRFGHDGTKCCILLGTTATTLQYPRVTIAEVVTAFSSANLAWGTGWSISQITDETGITIQSTPTMNLGRNSDTANKLATARTISLTGDLSGSASFDGSANISISAAVSNDSHDHTYLLGTDDRDVKPNATGISGKSAIKAFFTSRGGLESGTADADYQDFLVLDTHTDGTGGLVNALAFDKSTQEIRHYQGTWNSASWSTPKLLAYTDSNVATATALQTPRNINGVSFNGTADITVEDATKLPLAGGTLTGDLSVGSTSRTANTTVKALAGDGYTAGFEAYGSSQGTGYVYVGQSTTHGGGIAYNGDGTPTFATGEVSDTVAFYRRTASVNEVVFSYPHDSNNVTFRGTISGNGSGLTNLNATNLASGTVAVARLPAASTSAAGISQLSTSVSSTSTTLAATASAVKTVNDALTTHKTSTDHDSRYYTKAEVDGLITGTGISEDDAITLAIIFG